MAAGFDYHFLVLSPGLQSAWFFQAARQYWRRFQPIVTDDVELLRLIPASQTVAVTLLARPDTADYAEAQLRSQRPDNLRIDKLVVDDLPTMEAVLNKRAADDKPLG